jgi:hypothetical protein
MHIRRRNIGAFSLYKQLPHGDQVCAIAIGASSYIHAVSFFAL